MAPKATGVVSSAPTIGFIGLGNMGTPMSRRLAQAGQAVVGYDVSEEARRRVGDLGVRTENELGAVAKRSQLLILMLPNSDTVERVLSDPTLLSQLEPGALVIDMSSSEPLRTRTLAKSLDESGFRMIDAPVSGGVSGAEAGKLTIMVGGDAPDLDEARPCLEVLGRVVHAGAVGAGHAIKALNNLLSATHLWATSEVMLVGKRLGIDPGVMLAIFNSSSGRSGSTENKWPNFILPGTFNSGFGLRLMTKDMSIAVDLARQVGVPSILGSDALELWTRAAADLPATADHTEVARWLEAEAKANDD
jgi:3-hydroxyisobutyrate dehydrogenase